ncbi:hypothetical protein DS745_02380 [Anaerobacillus alkaliphilus]|uniref:Uncharacterized protein n=1 Tax=Anaerobacillus alkaliphilus TaxID=1548597 RepID=A0A4Q0VXW8_9BACI|nr:hypothetical protein DS745_02380 [Anaerobacillus alkaliphilus]
MLLTIALLFLGHQLYVTKTLLNQQQYVDFLSVEREFSLVALRSEELLRVWDAENIQDSAKLLSQQILLSSELLYNRIATKYYEVGLASTSTSGFSELSRFFSIIIKQYLMTYL